MATLESRLEVLEKAILAQDQSQGDDWQATCRALQAKNKDLQAKNDALQKVIERYESNTQNVDPTTVLPKDSTNDYQSTIAHIDIVRRDFIDVKQRLNDTAALELHFRQKSQQQQEACLLATTELDRTRRDLRMSEEKQAILQQRWLEVSQEKSKLELSLQKLQLDTETLSRSREEISRQVEAAVKESKQLSAKLEQTEVLLKTREESCKCRTETPAFESSITKFDNIAGEDIVAYLQEINLKILDIAAAVSEGVRVSGGARATPPVDKARMDGLGHVIGPLLLRHLRDKDHSNDPTLIQLAIQSALVNLVCRYCACWPIPYDSMLKDPLWSIYDRIRANELQAIASRWRALSTKHYRRRYPEEYQVLINTTDNTAIDMMATIALVAGGDSKKMHEVVAQLARNDLDRLWEVTCFFCEKIKEQVFLTDYQPFFTEASTAYDERTMRKQGSASGTKRRISRSNPPKVLCTVELGLRSVTNPTKPGEKNDGRLEEVIMDKAVVIFESEADALAQ